MPPEDQINEQCKKALIASKEEIKAGISELNDIILYLYSGFAITDLQEAKITHKSLILSEQIDELLRVVQGGSQKLFEEFIKSLFYTNRSHVVNAINENLNDNGHDIIDILKMQACLKSSRKDFKISRLVYKTMTTDVSCEASRWLAPIDKTPPATRFPISSGAEKPNSTQNVTDERVQSIDFPLMGALDTPSPRPYAPVVREYDFNPRNCAILQISNYMFGHETRSGYEGDRRSFESLRRHFNVPATSKIPVISIENQTREQILTAVQDFVKAIQALPANERIDGSAVFIVTHGKDAEIKGTDGHLLRLAEIFSEFTLTKCSKLANKPKLFFIEACRGGWGHYAANNGTIGSYFIRALTGVLLEESNKGDTIEKILKKAGFFPLCSSSLSFRMRGINGGCKFRCAIE
uniref:Caspase family p20 domain-containing protein n=1 Tax=Plectus sambesii TaxID=2011161 RepID=A0A914VH42_9BILA